MDEKNARYSELITSAAHKHFKIEKPPPENEGPAAYLVEAPPPTSGAQPSSCCASFTRS